MHIRSKDILLKLMAGKKQFHLSTFQNFRDFHLSVTPWSGCSLNGFPACGAGAQGSWANGPGWTLGLLKPTRKMMLNRY